MHVVVAGGGILGLWTAYELLERGHEVTIIRAARHEQTTSAAAVAVLTPFFPGDPTSASFQARLGWARETLTKIKALDVRSEFLEQIPCYEFGLGDMLETDFPVSKLNHLDFSEFRRVDLADEIDGCDFAIGFHCYLCNSGLFLTWLESEVVKRGAAVLAAKIPSPEDLLTYGSDGIVVCFGYQEVFPDPELYPVLGQSMFVPESHGDGLFGIGAGHHAVFRHRRGYYIGSYFLENEVGSAPREDLYQRSIDFVRGPFPDLCRSVGVEPPVIDLSAIAKVNAGVRPFRRSGPRVELDLTYGTPVVHNYGHGAHGWTVGYGSAVKAVDLLEGAVGRGMVRG